MAAHNPHFVSQPSIESDNDTFHIVPNIVLRTIFGTRLNSALDIEESERGTFPAGQKINMFLGATASGQIKVSHLVASAIIGILWVVACKVGVALLFGDRFRKATPKELQWGSAIFAFVPIWGALCIYFGHSYLDRAGPVGLWFCAMGAMLAFCMWLWAWTRFVSAKVSWWFGGFVWAITLWLAFTNRLV